MCCWVMRMAEYIHGTGRCSMERGEECCWQEPQMWGTSGLFGVKETVWLETQQGPAEIYRTGIPSGCGAA